MAGLETVYAVHNFEAENHDEIAFKIGEPIIVLEKDEEYRDGWWQVCNTKSMFVRGYTMHTDMQVNIRDKTRKVKLVCFQ